MGKKISPSSKWRCINVNCRAINLVGTCPNCNSGDLKTWYYLGRHRIECQNCGNDWSWLICPKCKSKTDVERSGLPLEECFIATAAYGSPYVREVELLRQYRDMHLKQTAIGRFVVLLYECISPPIAIWVAKRPFVRQFVRLTIMPPLLWIARHRVGK